MTEIAVGALGYEREPPTAPPNYYSGQPNPVRGTPINRIAPEMGSDCGCPDPFEMGTKAVRDRTMVATEDLSDGMLMANSSCVYGFPTRGARFTFT